MSNEKTPGEILRETRELRGHQQSDVAERLRLSVQTIIDIENDDYSHFSAEIYLRGHMKSYARFVGADVNDVLRAYESLGIEIESDPQMPVMLAENVSVSKRARRAKRKMLLWAGVGVFFILVLMVIMWWQEQSPSVATDAEVVGLTEPTKVVDAPVPAASVEKVVKKVSSKKAAKKTLHNVAAKPKKYTPDYTIEPAK